MDKRSVMIYTEDEVQRRLVRQIVQETLLGLGFDTKDPSNLQADMHYLRKIRSGSEDMVRIIRRSAITVSFTTALYLVWEAFKTLVQK